MKKVLSLITALALACSLVACGGKDDSSTVEGNAWEQELATPGVIKVGISPDYPPYEFYDEENNIAGFDVDMANELAVYIGGENGAYTIEFVPMDFDNIISALNAGTIDVGISCFTEDPERECMFTVPYLESSQVVVVAVDANITTVEDLAGTTITAGANTTGEGVAQALAAEYGIEVSTPTGAGYPMLFQNLSAGAVSAVVCDKAVGESFVMNNPDVFVILEGEYGDVEKTCVIVKKGNDNLYAVVNDAVIAFNESAKKADLVGQYFAAAEEENTEV